MDQKYEFLFPTINEVLLFVLVVWYSGNVEFLLPICERSVYGKVLHLHPSEIMLRLVLSN